MPWLRQHLPGLPDATQENEVTNYRGGLRLEGIAQPYIGVGADRFGTAIGGGLSLGFSDMLGNQNLFVAAQIQQGISGSYDFGNTAAQAVYLNQSHRLNWGLIGGQVPYLTGGIQQTLGTVGGQPAVIDQRAEPVAVEAVADLVVVLGVDHRPVEVEPGPRPALATAPDGGALPPVQQAMAEHARQVGRPPEVGVVAVGLAGQRHVERVVGVVAPLGVHP